MGDQEPIHSTKSEVYHDNGVCAARNNIEPENRRPGKGGRRHCDRCAELNARGVRLVLAA